MVMQNTGRPILIAAGALGAAAMLFSAIAISQATAWAILPTSHHATVQAAPERAATAPAAAPLSKAPSVPAPAASGTSNAAPVHAQPGATQLRINPCTMGGLPGPGRMLPMCAPPAPQP